eukprot:gb/GECG01007446.1/.p1 GENE.gb/GECG01007446.1/~~gb/GECG01007446.1/.p1  ORF type:complete len:642 (+),score=96.80 gb/GECG01007446.1/:1-1926(+)
MSNKASSPSSSASPSFGQQIKGWLSALGGSRGPYDARTGSVRLQDLGPGDILLIQSRLKSGNLVQGVSLPPQVVRTIQSAHTRGTVGIQQQKLNSFTHAALVLKRKGRSYVALPTREGIELFPAYRWLKKLLSNGVKVVVRQLKVSFTSEMRSVLEDLLKMAARGCSWTQQIPGSVSARSEGDHATGDNDNVSPAESSANIPMTSTPRSSSTARHQRNSSIARGSASAASMDDKSSTARSSRSDGSSTLVSERSDLSPFGKKFLGMLLPRIWASVSKVPAQVQLELKRAFRNFDTDNDGCVSQEEFGSVLQELHGSFPLQYEVSQLLKLLPDPEATSISERDILYALVRNPLKQIPLEHDLDAIVCGEFVATVYELMGLLPERSIETLKKSSTTLDTSHLERRVPEEDGKQERLLEQEQSAKESPAEVKSADEEDNKSGPRKTGKVAPDPDVSSDHDAATTDEENVTTRRGSNSSENSGEELFSSSSAPRRKKRSQKKLQEAISEAKENERERQRQIQAKRALDKEKTRSSMEEKNHQRMMADARNSRYNGIASPRKKQINKSYAYSIVVLDDSATETDFSHFVPMSFCSKHKPPLRLRHGKLTNEAPVELPDEEDEESEEGTPPKDPKRETKNTKKIVPT